MKLNENNVDLVLQKINSHKNNKLTFEMYHHDDSSEPYVFIQGYLERVFSEYVEGHGNIISIVTPETNLTFSENNFDFSIGNNAIEYIVFNSKNDCETYCLITFD